MGGGSSTCDYTNYTPNSKVESDYILKSKVKSDYISKGVLNTNYMLKTDCKPSCDFSNYTLNLKVNSDYVLKSKVDSDYTLNSKVNSDYVLKSKVDSDFVPKSNYDEVLKDKLQTLRWYSYIRDGANEMSKAIDNVSDKCKTQGENVMSSGNDLIIQLNKLQVDYKNIDNLTKKDIPSKFYGSSILYKPIDDKVLSLYKEYKRCEIKNKMLLEINNFKSSCSIQSESLNALDKAISSYLQGDIRNNNTDTILAAIKEYALNNFGNDYIVHIKHSSHLNKKLENEITERKSNNWKDVPILEDDTETYEPLSNAKAVNIVITLLFAVALCVAIILGLSSYEPIKKYVNTTEYTNENW